MKLSSLFKDLRFKYKLVLSYSVLAIIPIVLLGGYSYLESRRSLESRTRLSLESFVRQTALKLHSKEMLYESVFDDLVVDQSIQRLFGSRGDDMYRTYVEVTESFHPMVQSFLYRYREIERITVYNRNDVPEYADMIRRFESIANTEWARNAEAKTCWYVENGRLFGVRKLNNLYATNQLGVLRIDFDSRQTFDVQANTGVSEYGFMVVTDTGRELFHRTTMQASGAALLRRIVEEGATGVVSLEGTRYLVIRDEPAEAGWHACFLTPYRSLGVGAGGILRATAVVVGGCVGLLAILILVFSRTFVGRIRQLNASIRAVEEGDLHVQIRSDSKDEIGELANRFGSMVRRINSLITEVYKSRIVRREAEIRALQAQINPHFLYNTLSLINWKAKLIEATEICDIVRAMTKYFRTTLSKGQDVVSIQAELENVRSYVYIQRVLHDRSFSVEYRVDEAVYGYHTLKLLLQPVVENAILHGLDASKRSDKHLVVEAAKRENRILFAVSDNGVGMDARDSSQGQGSYGGGYGLRNVRERVRHFFGEEFGVYVESAQGEGTTVRIVIPAYRLPEVAEEPLPTDDSPR